MFDPEEEAGFRSGRTEAPPPSLSCSSTDVCKIYDVAYSFVDAGNKNSLGRKTLQAKNDPLQGFVDSFIAKNGDCATELFIPLQFSRSKLEGLQTLRSRRTDRMIEIAAILYVLDRPFEIAQDRSQTPNNDCDTQLDAIGDYSKTLKHQLDDHANTNTCTRTVYERLIFIDALLSYWHVTLKKGEFPKLVHKLEASTLPSLVSDDVQIIKQRLTSIVNSL